MLIYNQDADTSILILWHLYIMQISYQLSLIPRLSCVGKSLGTRLISTICMSGLGPLSKESVQNFALQACIYVFWQIITLAKLHSYQCISIMHAAHAYVMEGISKQQSAQWPQWHRVLHSNLTFRPSIPPGSTTCA